MLPILPPISQRYLTTATTTTSTTTTAAIVAIVWLSISQLACHKGRGSALIGAVVVVVVFGVVDDLRSHE